MIITATGRVRATATAVAMLLAVTVSACSSTPSAAPAARKYLRAWAAGDDAAAGAATDAPAEATAALEKARGALHITGLKATAGKQSTSKDATTVAFHATVSLRGLGDWAYDGRLAMRRQGGRWTVHWEPADIHPRLTAVNSLAVSRTLPDRAPLLDAAGQPLFTATPVVTVGIEPARLAGKDAQATYAALARLLHIDPARLAAQVKAAKAHAFVPVITLRRPAYDRVRAQIHDLPGTVFAEGTRQLPPTTEFARALLGRVGEATAEVLKRAGSGYVAGDQLGLGGLEEAFQKQLAGTASGKVQLVDAQGNPVATLHEFKGVPGTPVRTTLDRRLQEAADAVLAGVGKPAALVAVRPSDGAVLAVANAPGDSSYDRALTGRYPPGSTFKVATTYALLGAGLAPTTAVPCPPVLNVGGKAFHNFEGEAKGNATLAEDFAISCNTAFVGASRRLKPAALPAAAKAFGLGVPWSLPVDSFPGSVPPPGDPVEQAADAVGQGKVEASVLGMALVAAAVQSGTWRPPVLVTDPAQPAGPAAQPLVAERVAILQGLMGRVVTGGTAAAAGLPAGTAGKTGTAEFGNDSPPKTHAWFIGFRGDLAVAVLVEGGGVGGAVAAPLAAAFLKAVG